MNHTAARVADSGVDRFWSKVAEPDANGCRLWLGAASNGYGRFWTGERTVYAHRFALGLVDRADDGMQVDHLCRVRLCVERTHLELVTQKVNHDRQVEATPASDECSKGHTYTEATTITDSSGRRRCRICTNERRAAWMRERRAR